MTQTATPQTDAPAVPAIFEPIEINGVRVRNRLIPVSYTHLTLPTTPYV